MSKKFLLDFLFLEKSDVTLLVIGIGKSFVYCCTEICQY